MYEEELTNIDRDAFQQLEAPQPLEDQAIHVPLPLEDLSKSCVPIGLGEASSAEGIATSEARMLCVQTSVPIHFCRASTSPSIFALGSCFHSGLGVQITARCV